MEDVANDTMVLTTITLLLRGGRLMSQQLHGSQWNWLNSTRYWSKAECDQPAFDQTITQQCHSLWRM